MEFKIYDYLPQEAKYIRTTVFVEEQGFEEEFDKDDNCAKHILAFDGDRAVATCRYFAQENYYLIGRIAVMKEYRGLGIGGDMIALAKREIERVGGKEIRIHSQKKAVGFYQKQGYEPFGEMDFDEGCEHIWMKMTL
ncbi:MAG: GNAT family N-acetyltransferase [Clostridia bacterium]|nr:GNAT family N-acetyltransferase [Clostridia bacterium]